MSHEEGRIQTTLVGLIGARGCDAPGCVAQGDWGIGLEMSGDTYLGHVACMDHVADGLLVTIEQLRRRNQAQTPRVIVTLLEL